MEEVRRLMELVGRREVSLEAVVGRTGGGAGAGLMAGVGLGEGDRFLG